MSVTIDRLDDYLTGGGDPGPLVDTNCAWCLAPLSGDVDEDVELCDGCRWGLAPVLASTTPPADPPTVPESTVVAPAEPARDDTPAVAMPVGELAGTHRVPRQERDRLGVYLAVCLAVGLGAVTGLGVVQVDALHAPAPTEPAISVARPEVNTPTSRPCDIDPTACGARIVPVGYTGTSVTSLAAVVGRAALLEVQP